ncbi:hypothetical protein D3C78_1354800 [compost metagenome]
MLVGEPALDRHVAARAEVHHLVEPVAAAEGPLVGAEGRREGPAVLLDQALGDAVGAGLVGEDAPVAIALRPLHAHAEGRFEVLDESRLLVGHQRVAHDSPLTTRTTCSRADTKGCGR